MPIMMTKAMYLYTIHTIYDNDDQNLWINQWNEWTLMLQREIAIAWQSNLYTQIYKLMVWMKIKHVFLEYRPLLRDKFKKWLYTVVESAIRKEV